MYKPARKRGACKNINIKRPINLTEALFKVYEGIKDGRDSNHDFTSKIKDTKHAVVEYDDEILIVKDRIKLCININTRKPQWGSKLGFFDKGEGGFSGKKLMHKIKNKKRWKSLLAIAKKEIDDRNKSDWKWKDIKTK